MTLEPGDRFSAELDVIRSGTGFANVNRTTISVGPMNQDADGDLVQLKYLGERETDSMTSNYAVCLTEEVTDDEYDDYLRDIIDLMTSGGVPSTGEVTYAEVADIVDKDIGVAEIDGERVVLGPIRASVGEFVQIEGVTSSHARVVNEDIRREDYELRFNLLAGLYNKLPVSQGAEYTTAIAEIKDGTPIAYVKNVPVSLPGADGELGQKVDIRITKFSDDKVIGSVIEWYDEVSRIENPGHWARMQWLEESGYDENPFRSFASDFIGTDLESLPADTGRVKDALVSEAIRLALHDKAQESDEQYPRAHISGLRHWVLRKLAAILGEPDKDADNWFRETLTEGSGQSLVFLGDVLELSKGYYAAGPTRAVITGSQEAVLISGQPTRVFEAKGLPVELRGLARVITGSDRDALVDAGIPTQELDAYINEDTTSYDREYLREFINSRNQQAWVGDATWEAYTGGTGYGFDWGDEPLRVELESGEIVSIWSLPVEYGSDEYYLKIEHVDPPVTMVQVPVRYLKQICLILDELAGVPRTVELSPLPEAVHLKCNFPPPRAQCRWLAAIGATWREYRQGLLHWEIDQSAADSVEQAFDSLPVTIRNEIN